ncbi:FtsW/RodA/SpoVE family cell cycle protein [Virgibacillus halophilus]|uniref:FtsW/RodA/SpoVE family cell cycle protein n=1 Tax=Tigheibacillus halophilus TaxID=361280 RepID=A0ABU5C816_9BACI|nr:FtsW/RodA/SpoVE family cell cycle protein [Virgibacillus halophilus]
MAVLLVSPESIARTINHSKSWFTLPGFSMQPSEFAKISTVLYFAAVISKHKEKYPKSNWKTDVFLLLKIGMIVIAPVLLINMQPDFGSSMVYLFIAAVFVLLSGIDWKIIATLVLGGAAVLFSALWVIVTFPQMSEQVLGLEQYQVQRVLTWFDASGQTSDDTFHFDRSLSALGSGQLTGKGMSALQVSLPEAHTDFIFSVVGESFGFVGCAIVVFLYFLLLYRMLMLGLNSFHFTMFGAYICFGFLSLIFIHAFQNIGMIVGIMPITGIPLLLLSYGGSSVMSSMIGLGLVYRVAVENTMQNDYLFK